MYSQLGFLVPTSIRISKGQIQFFKSSSFSTVCKFHDFSINQFLREINFGDFKNAKSAFFTTSKALTLYFYDVFCTFWRLKFKKKKSTFRAPKVKKKLAVFWLQEVTKLISRKIWVIEKSWNFTYLHFWHFFRFL